MAKEMKTLNDAFLEELQDAYDFEHQIVKALPKVAEAAGNEELQAALESHLAETKGQIARLEEVFSLLGEKVEGKHCAGMAGILEEGDEAVADDEFEPEIKDAMLIAGCQRVEHYEMAVYGTLVAWANMLDLPDVEALLQQNLDEEENADATLSELSEMEFDIETAEA